MDDSYRSNILKSLFRRVRIKAFASGENAHTLPLDVNVLKASAYTIYDQPVLWKYNPFTDDAMAHEEDEVPCGFVPREDNPITFLEEDGRTYIVIDALIWTRYTGRLVKIFERDDLEKAISVEIHQKGIEHEDGIEITDYVFTGITILGDWYNPAVKGCKAEMIEFSADKTKFMNLYYGDGQVIDIANTKDASVSGNWSNPRRKLFVPIVDAKNSDQLFNEAYLIHDADSPTLYTSKYPHHVIEDGKLVIHIDGLQAAFSRASQNGIVHGKIKEHLMRHYKELGLNTDNFSEFNLSEEMFVEYSKYLNEGVGDNLTTVNEAVMAELKRICVEKFGEGVEVVSVEDDVIMYTLDGSECTQKFVTAETEDGMTYSFVDDEDDSDDDDDSGDDGEKNPDDGEKPDDEDQDDDQDDGDQEDNETAFEDLKVQFADLTKRFADLEAEHEDAKDKIAKFEEEAEATKEKLEAMSDYEVLKQFKFDTDADNATKSRLAEMEMVYSEIAEKGIVLTDDHREELNQKFSELGNIDAWRNFAKAFALDAMTLSDGAFGMQYPSSGKKSTGSIWDNI